MMRTPSQIIFKAFLDGCDFEKRESLLRFLPDSDIEVLAHLSPPFKDLSGGLAGEDVLLDSFHTSWFEASLRTLAASDLALVLAAFSPAQQTQLSQDIGFSNTLPTLTPSGRTYLRSFLFNEIKKDALPLLPIECLPKTPFNTLLYFSYKQKLKLIDLLSMFDLVIEIKHIIEKPKLTQITTTLSEEERILLTKLSKQKEGPHFKSMNLNQWDGSPDTLKALLRQRGINRLSKATFGSDPSFQWILCHQLDTTSTALFQKLHTSLKNPEATKTLQEQILSLIEIFQDQHPKEGH